MKSFICIISLLELMITQFCLIQNFQNIFSKNLQFCLLKNLIFNIGKINRQYCNLHYWVITIKHYCKRQKCKIIFDKIPEFDLKNPGKSVRNQGIIIPENNIFTFV